MKQHATFVEKIFFKKFPDDKNYCKVRDQMNTEVHHIVYTI